MRDRDDLELLTSTEVAQLLRVREQSLRVMRVRGRGPKFVRAGDGPNSRVLYSVRDVREWIDTRKRRSTAEDHAAADLQRAAE